MTDTGYALTIISDTEAEMTRLFDAPRELVYRAYTDPAAIPHWWGPRSLSTKVEAMDVRPGGAWRYVQADAEGNEYTFYGEYLELVPNEKVVNTFVFEPFPDHVITDAATFTDEDGRTRVTVHSTTSDPAALKGMLDSGMEAGAIESWDRLAEFLASQPA
jgi:uncharacterized protein YndB with AHSA1/START domain